MASGVDSTLPAHRTTADFAEARWPAQHALLLSETTPSRPDRPVVPQFEISHNVAALLAICSARITEVSMSKRIDKSWLVFMSIENFDHNRCVDLFSRPDGSCGYEEFRRDVEDRGEWTPVQYYSGSVYMSREAALAAAMQTVAWLADAVGQSPAAQKLLRRIAG
ncbi:MAG: hypothetical protein WBQ24_03230 [Xanthobacteraceae bacterium]